MPDDLPTRSFWQHMRLPLPLQESLVTRMLARTLGWYAHRRRMLWIRGVEHVSPANDPFIFVANHSQRPEAVLLPTAIVTHRQGKLIHFIADWPFLLVPFVANLYRRSGIIRVMKKDARPRCLNVFKPLFQVEGTAFERARAVLDGGASVGIFPEGTINRDPRRLLRGHPGAALLALQAGVPVVPAGISFPGHDPDRPIGDRARMAITIGEPIPVPSFDGPRPRRSDVRAFHGTIMQALARLSGKQWHPGARRRRDPHG